MEKQFEDTGLGRREMRREANSAARRKQKHDWVSFNFVTGGVVMRFFVRERQREGVNTFLPQAYHASKPLPYPNHQLPCGTRSDNNENQSCGPPSLCGTPNTFSHPLGHLRSTDPHRGSQVWCRVVVEAGNKKVSIERPSGVHLCAVATEKSISRAKLRAKQTPTSRSCVHKEITWVIEIFLAVMTS